MDFTVSNKKVNRSETFTVDLGEGLDFAGFVAKFGEGVVRDQALGAMIIEVQAKARASMQKVEGEGDAKSIVPSDASHDDIQQAINAHVFGAGRKRADPKVKAATSLKATLKGLSPKEQKARMQEIFDAALAALAEGDGDDEENGD